MQGCNVHQAFKSQRTPVRVQALRYVRAEQQSEEKHHAVRATLKSVTAFLAAGAVLLPHTAMAVSGGGGMLGIDATKALLAATDLKLFIAQALALHTTMRTCPTRTCGKTHIPKQSCAKQISVTQT